MADKYKHLKKKIRKNRKKEKSCDSKKSFETKAEAYQKGQQTYKCKYCQKYHRSGKMSKFLFEMGIRKKKD